jgi:hypothetical protein
MPQANYEIWCQRWQALHSTIQHHLRRLENEPNQIDRQETVQSLLTTLRYFGKSQVGFFVRGFSPGASPRLEPSPDYPPEYALRVTVDQIAYDLDVLQRAQQQRTKGSSSREMRETLALADTLAYAALEPAIRQGLIDHTTVVTYFQKLVNVRIIPYAPVALIGLPLSAMTVTHDLLAIPHEVGHYIFRYGRVQHGAHKGSRFETALASELKTMAQPIPQWALNWLEEIFADVYGALVAGPIMALGFEDLITDDPFAEFVHDDGEHPIAALRLPIYHRVLHNLGNYTAELKALQGRWQAIVAQRGAPVSFVPAGSTEQISLKDAQLVMEQIVDLIMAGDLGQTPTDREQWSPALSERKQVEDLVTGFAQTVQQQRTLDAQVPDVQLFKRDNGEDWIRLLPRKNQSGLAPVERKAGTTGLTLDAIKEAKNGDILSLAQWLELLDGSGWAVEGPGNNAH